MRFRPDGRGVLLCPGVMSSLNRETEGGVKRPLATLERKASKVVPCRPASGGEP